ncbi:efflux RND transporter periplasmic adaptor subunit [Gilvimarinus chinensis]|uniref:efflux RND transporter periplasmic adaptor subunit n=1 Tax=Gilvimarinus chinensis TaxID=396005 RepID=UPI00037AC9D2|nr:HlyD family efflux transporter periplasmic adaptor subunit [Gilvimarinus chinensis]
MLIRILFCMVFIPLSFWANASNNHENSSTDSTEISEEIAERSGIIAKAASSGNVERHIQVFGSLRTPPHSLAQVSARFSGLVKSVSVNVGDAVEQGSQLAMIESNDSLQDYPIKAPLTGRIQERNINPGEITGVEPLFTIINNDTLWAELQVFPSQRYEIKPGQSVHIGHNNHKHKGTIHHILPGPEGAPYVIARVLLENNNDDLSPGDMVNAQINVEVLQAEVVVEAQALQEFEGGTVVFIQQGQNYYARPVKVGVNDGQYAQITDGLSAGERYVAVNSYLVKADIKKSGAAHSH